MAARIIKSHPKSGSVSRRKIRAAVRELVKAGRPKYKKGALTKAQTASGRGQIAFKRAPTRAVA